MRMLQMVVAVAILGSILAAAFGGGGVLLARNIPVVMEGWSSRAWPAVQGEIREAEAVARPVVASPRRGAVASHVLRLRYVYAVQNNVYTGSRRSLADEGVLRGQEYAEREAAAMRVGTKVSVYYNPADPSRSLLIQGVPGAGVIGVIIGVVLIAGGLALVAIALYLRAHHAKRREKRGV